MSRVHRDPPTDAFLATTTTAAFVAEGGDADEARLAHAIRDSWLAVAEATRAVERLEKMPGATIGMLQRVIAADGMTPAALAVALDRPRPRVSELVNRLIGDGLVRRRPSPTDGRSVDIVATPAGQDVIERFARGRVRVVSRSLERLSKRDRERLVAVAPLLERLRAELAALEDDADGVRRTA